MASTLNGPQGNLEQAVARPGGIVVERGEN